jgi:hypothetical protein
VLVADLCTPNGRQERVFDELARSLQRTTRISMTAMLQEPRRFDQARLDGACGMATSLGPFPWPVWHAQGSIASHPLDGRRHR